MFHCNDTFQDPTAQSLTDNAHQQLWDISEQGASLSQAFMEGSLPCPDDGSAQDFYDDTVSLIQSFMDSSLPYTDDGIMHNHCIRDLPTSTGHDPLASAFEPLQHTDLLADFNAVTFYNVGGNDYTAHMNEAFDVHSRQFGEKGQADDSFATLLAYSSSFA